MIFDTSIWVGLASGQIPSQSILRAAGDEQVYISAISLGERKGRTALYIGITLVATLLVFYGLSLIYPAYGAMLGTVAAMDLVVNCSLVGIWHSRRTRKQS